MGELSLEQVQQLVITVAFALIYVLVGGTLMLLREPLARQLYRWTGWRWLVWLGAEADADAPAAAERANRPARPARVAPHPAAVVGGAAGATDYIEEPMVPFDAWAAQVQDNPTRLPHTLVLGPSGVGKSTLMEALARTRPDLLLVIQPNREVGQWDGIPVVECDDAGSFAPIDAALALLHAEFARRGGAMKRGDPGPWLTIVWDEIPLCLKKIKGANDLVVLLLSAGRPRKMRLLGGSTSDRVGALGIEGYGDLLDSAAILRLGAFAIDVEPDLAEWAELATTLELRRQLLVVERGPVLDLRLTPVGPERWFTGGVVAPEAVHDAAPPAPMPEDARGRPAAVIPLFPGRKRTETAVEISEGVETDFPASESGSEISPSPENLAEIAQIAAGIQARKGKTEILLALPTYTGRQHKRLSSLYEQVQQALADGSARDDARA